MLWKLYVQLTPIESVLRSLKSELGIRPIRHQLEHRADAHILIAFLGYCLQVTLKNRLLIHAPGLTAAAVLEKLATIQMVEVWIPMVAGWCCPDTLSRRKMFKLCCITSTWCCLSQPPPRIKASQMPLAPVQPVATQPSLW